MICGMPGCPQHMDTLFFPTPARPAVPFAGLAGPIYQRYALAISQRDISQLPDHLGKASCT